MFQEFFPKNFSKKVALNFFSKGVFDIQIVRLSTGNSSAPAEIA